MVFYAFGKSIPQIIQQLSRRSQGEYATLSAQQHYQQRLEYKPKRKLSNLRLFKFVKRKFLQENWLPEKIVSRLKHEQSTLFVSVVSIYQGGCWVI